MTEDPEETVEETTTETETTDSHRAAVHLHLMAAESLIHAEVVAKKARMIRIKTVVDITRQARKRSARQDPKKIRTEPELSSDLNRLSRSPRMISRVSRYQRSSRSVSLQTV